MAVDAVSCPDCVFGPETFVRGKGAPADETITFAAIPGSMYVAEIERISDAEVLGEVTLNSDQLISPGHSPNDPDILGRRVVSLASSNQLAVRLVGRPGSGIRIAIHAPTTVAFYGLVTIAALPPQIDGVFGTPYAYTIANYTKWPRSNIAVQASVEQGAASRAAGGQLIACGGALGELPPGLCSGSASLFPSNANAGTGTLVAGGAFARFDLVEVQTGGSTVLDAQWIPTTLLGPPAPSVLQVTVVPSSRWVARGVPMQLSADVQVAGGAPKTVTWSSDKPTVATVDATGKATAVSFGDAVITATSTFDPTKKGTALIHVIDIDLRITTPSTAVSISTGATNPPANPLNVQLVAKSCGPTAIYNNPFARVDFEVVTSGIVVVGSVVVPTLTDNGSERCWSYPFVWTPGMAFGTGTQSVAAAGYGADGALVAFAQQNAVIITTNP
jgi:hypothetical protein